MNTVVFKVTSGHNNDTTWTLWSDGTVSYRSSNEEERSWGYWRWNSNTHCIEFKSLSGNSWTPDDDDSQKTFTNVYIALIEKSLLEE